MKHPQYSFRAFPSPNPKHRLTAAHFNKSDLTSSTKSSQFCKAPYFSLQYFPYYPLFFLSSCNVNQLQILGFPTILVFHCG